MAALFDVLLRGLRDTGLFAGKADLDTAVSGLNTKVDSAIVDLTAVASAAGFTTRVVRTSSGTWTAPAKKTYRVTCVGGGGNGSNTVSKSWNIGNGGRAGAVTINYVSLAAGDVVACTVGGPGGTTMFGSYLSAAGAAGPYGISGAMGNGGTNGTGYGGGGGTKSNGTAGTTFGNDGGTNGTTAGPGTGGPGAIIIEY